MKNSVELRQERAGLIEESNGMLETCKNESRNLTDDEQVSYDAKMSKIDNLKKDIDMVERQEKLNAEIASAPVSFGTQNVKESKEIREFSFVDAAKAAYTGRVTGLVAEMDQEARNENPSQAFKGIAIPYSVLNSSEQRGATAGAVKGTEVSSFIDQLEAASVLVQAGSNFYSGLSADRKFPIVQGITSTWATEAALTNDVTAAGDVTSKTLSPKKVISVVDMSPESLVQNAGLEGALRKNIASSMMAKMEAALLAQTDVTSAPESIFSDAGAYGTGAADVALLAALEATVVGNGAGLDSNLGYIMNPAAWSAIAAAAGADFTNGYLNLADKVINNTPYFVTSALGADGTASKDQVLCGDFSKVHLGVFGGLDILFDPYTLAGKGGARMVATGLVDGIAAQAGTIFQKSIEA